MIVSNDFISGVLTQFEAVFEQKRSEAPVQWNRVAREVDANDRKTVQFFGLGQAPTMRTFQGTYEVGEAFTHSYSVTPTRRGVIVEIEKDSLRYNPLSEITAFIANISEQAMLYYDQQIFAQMSGAFVSLSFDGVAFYSASHTFGNSAAYDNVDTAVLNSDGVAYNALWAAINTAQGDHGVPLGYVPTDLVVHTNNRFTARKMLNAEVLGTDTNVNKGDVNLVITPFLTTTTEWHLIAKGADAPFLLVVDVPPTFTDQMGEDSDGVFRKEVVAVKIACKCATANGDPRRAAASDGTV
ncbi:MAG: Mu-like prophage major head subunit gpT family protein [Candidatus Zixiibacteriota bacterium]